MHLKNVKREPDLVFGHDADFFSAKCSCFNVIVKAFNVTVFDILSLCEPARVGLSK